VARASGADLRARRVVSRSRPRRSARGAIAISPVSAAPPAGTARSRDCPVCGGAFHGWLTATDRNRRTDTRGFPYLRCASCGLIRIEKAPADLARYYAEDYYAIPSLERLREIARREAYQLRLLTPHARSGRLLEIGPAWGQFAWQAKEAGFQVSCIEMDARCCAYLRDVVGVEAHQSAAPERVLPDLQVQDAVVMWQVLEHLPDPWSCLEAIAGRLAPGGALLVATPSPAALSLRLQRAAWPHIDAPRHLWLIPLGVLATKAGTLGLDLAAAHFRDRGAWRWGLFAWQRLLMNAVPSALAVPAYAAGSALGGLMAPLELTGRRAASYTAIFVKRA
jgi:SAM-dependent methyltransferase